ncbi:MAG: hypothetical protein P1U58_14550 [Verrucomicrobiales bacterium]|nr:hypothetical protein [Verrucomicrobiales bacterium]
MYHDSEEPEFPNWWDVLDESVKDRRDPNIVDGSISDVVLSPTEGEMEEGMEGVVSEPSAAQYSISVARGYEREVVESVWNFAEIVPGNDPDLWRKDECGNWIRRLDYGRRESEFGWEIFDPGVGRHSQGVYAMRPMQWVHFLEQFEVFG